MSPIEQNQMIADAFRFELGKVMSKEIRQRVVNVFSQVTEDLVEITAEIVSKTIAPVKGVDSTFIEPQQSLLTAASVFPQELYRIQEKKILNADKTFNKSFIDAIAQISALGSNTSADSVK